MELELQDGKSTIESKSQFSGKAQIDGKSVEDDRFSDNLHGDMKSVNQVQISDGRSDSNSKCSKIEGENVKISIDILSEINTK